MAFYLRALCILAVVSLASCKQGIGERCQIAADCEPGLICEKNTEDTGSDVKVCKSESTAEIDAMPLPPVDADLADADTTDADPTDADPTDAS